MGGEREHACTNTHGFNARAQERFPGISYADLWTLAGVIAIEGMGGPVIPWSPGRKDTTQEACPVLPDGLLPDAAQGRQHL